MQIVLYIENNTKEPHTHHKRINTPQPPVIVSMTSKAKIGKSDSKNEENYKSIVAYNSLNKLTSSPESINNQNNFTKERRRKTEAVALKNFKRILIKPNNEIQEKSKIKVKFEKNLNNSFQTNNTSQLASKIKSEFNMYREERPKTSLPKQKSGQSFKSRASVQISELKRASLLVKSIDSKPNTLSKKRNPSIHKNPTEYISELIEKNFSKLVNVQINDNNRSYLEIEKIDLEIALK